MLELNQVLLTPVCALSIEGEIDPSNHGHKDSVLQSNNNLLLIQDYLRFLNMDDTSVKRAFVEWLTRIAIENDWIDKSGKPIRRQLAIYFELSAQSVNNWMDGVTYPSSQAINNILAPRRGISAARFWHELEMINHQLNGDIILSEKEKAQYLDTQLRNPTTGNEVWELIQRLSPSEQKIVAKKIFAKAATDS